MGYLHWNVYTMVVKEIFFHFNLLCIYSALLAAFLIWKNRLLISTKKEPLFFMICLAFYLFASGPRLTNIDLIFFASLVGTYLMPLSIWLLSRAVFKKKPFSRKTVLLLVFLTLLYQFPMTIWDQNSEPRYPDIISHTLSIVYILLSIFEIQMVSSEEVNTKSQRTKAYFMLSVSLVAALTIMLDLALLYEEYLYVFAYQRIIILLMTVYFIAVSFSYKGILINKAKKAVTSANPVLLENIERKMTTDKLYLHEKLTIGNLSEQLNEQEYKVRQAINQDLGYKNFIDFINSFRIQEAVSLLKDRTKANMTVLEIAHQTGFNSIGPFNRAFKATTGVTPTEFRKSQDALEEVLSIL